MNFFFHDMIRKQRFGLGKLRMTDRESESVRERKKERKRERERSVALDDARCPLEVALILPRKLDG